MTPEAFIKKFNIRCFYHFTDTRNLPSIRAHGLLSMAELKRRELQATHPGGNEWSQLADARAGVDRYVHLCLFNEHPMEYLARQDGRIEESVFLRVAPEVISLEGIVFSPEVANKAGARLLPLSDAIEQMDFEVIYTRTDWRDPLIQERRRLAKKYELLIPNHVPMKFVVEPTYG